MHSQTVTYEADGLAMRSDLYFDPALSGPRPGILVFPEAFGLGAHARERAAQLAERGYIVLAADLHGNATLHDSLQTAMPLITPLRENPEHIRARAQGALQALLARPETDAGRIAALGYCFGGTMALELARGGAAIAGAIGFHSGLATKRPQDAARIKARILVCIGADDPAVNAEERAAFEAEMRAVPGLDWQLHIYGGVVHSYTNKQADRMGRPEMARYDARADARSTATLHAFLDEIFNAE